MTKSWLEASRKAVKLGGSLTLVALLAGGCSAGYESDEDTQQVGQELKDGEDAPDSACVAPSKDPSRDLSTFADACTVAGGSVSCASDGSACCAMCTKEDGCHELCVNPELLAKVSEEPLSPEQEKAWNSLVEEAEAGSTERNHDDPPGDYTGCKNLCGDIWHACDKYTPLPSRWCWIIGMICIDICVGGMQGGVAP
jgi:hypothetical protein